MRRFPRPAVLTLGVLAAWALACTGARDPGGSDLDHGKVLFWEVEAADLEQFDCTDADDIQEALTLPALEEGTYFMYRLSEEGDTATAQDCSRLDADSCSPIDGLTFDVAGTSMVATPDPQTIDASGDCTVSLQETWTFDDRGEDGTLTLSLTFPFEGPAADCAALDTMLAAQGSNGLGLQDCEVVFDVDVLFTLADD